MLEYVFSNAEPCEQFRAFLGERGVASGIAKGELELIVQVEEANVDDTLADLIDARYDELFELDQRLYEAELSRASDNYQASGVVVNLKDGRAVYAGVRPDLLGKVMQALSPEELGELVDAIAGAVEDPDERSLCKRVSSTD